MSNIHQFWVHSIAWIKTNEFTIFFSTSWPMGFLEPYSNNSQIQHITSSIKIWNESLYFTYKHSNIAKYTYVMNYVPKMLILSMMCAYVWWLRALIDCAPKSGIRRQCNCDNMVAWKSLMASRMLVGVPFSLILYISVSSCIVVVWHTARGGNGTNFFFFRFS